MAWPPFTRAGHDRSALRYASDNSQSAKTGAEARGHVGFDAGKKVKGRKRHILVDRLGLILRAEVHSAGVQDRDGAALVFDRLARRFPFIVKICGDGAYQGPVVQTSSPRPIEIIKRNPTRLPSLAQAPDRRADVRLARHQATTGKGLRTLRAHQPRIHPNRHDQAHGDQAHGRAIGSLRLFLNRWGDWGLARARMRVAAAVGMSDT